MSEYLQEFFSIFHEMPRQGPGSRETTLAALDMIRSQLPNTPRILEIGCGSGGSTLDLACFCQGHVIALDNDEHSLERLIENAQDKGVHRCITTCFGNMTDLHFDRGAFDLIWSEGSAYIMGFQRAINYWRPFLCRNGLLVVSELVWTVDTPPVEAQEYWQQEYPGMRSLNETLNQVYAAGYHMLTHFLLDENDWEANYYTPMEKIIQSRRCKHPDCDSVKEVCDQLQTEIDVYRKYGYAFDYLFMICKKTMAA